MNSQEAIHLLNNLRAFAEEDDNPAIDMAIEALQDNWIPVSERLPKIYEKVILCSANGDVFIGYRDKPSIVWQVTEEGGRKHWVYDPEAYTDDIESLPKAEDCSFDNDSRYAEGMLSVSSVNYNDRFDGVVAWRPLPEPYEESEE